MTQEELIPITLEYNVWLTPSPEEKLHYRKHYLSAPTHMTRKLIVYIKKEDEYNFKLWKHELTNSLIEENTRLREKIKSLEQT